MLLVFQVPGLEFLLLCNTRVPVKHERLCSIFSAITVLAQHNKRHSILNEFILRCLEPRPQRVLHQFSNTVNIF